MIDVHEISELQRAMVVRWHRQAVDNTFTGFLGLVCQQHSFNYLLWHEEDIARSPVVSDAEIARVKRAIDRYNQQRNDGMEKLDDWITAQLAERSVAPSPETPQNTETPGAAIDRLSILALRIYHLAEQTERTDVSLQHIARTGDKLALCRAQHADLSRSLQELLADLTAGRKRHRTYRQLKMYNDPSLNPQMYNAARSKVA